VPAGFDDVDVMVCPWDFGGFAASGDRDLVPVDPHAVFGRLDVDAEPTGNGVVFEQEGERLGVGVRLVDRDDLDADGRLPVE
jgi:hypothetical protein